MMKQYETYIVVVSVNDYMTESGWSDVERLQFVDRKKAEAILKRKKQKYQDDPYYYVTMERDWIYI